MAIPEIEIGKVLLECFALSILSGLTRLFLLERTISGGWKQFFGGIVFGSLIGYLFFNISTNFEYFQYTGKNWRAWCVGCAVFGKEILYLFKSLIMDLLPFVRTFLINQGKRAARAWEAYQKNSDNA